MLSDGNDSRGGGRPLAGILRSTDVEDSLGPPDRIGNVVIVRVVRHADDDEAIGSGHSFAPVVPNSRHGGRGKYRFLVERHLAHDRQTSSLVHSHQLILQLTWQ